MEGRVKLSDSDADIQAYLALRFDGSNWIMFWNRPADANWQIYSEDGGAPTQQDSGIARDTDYHIFRIECHTHGGNHVHFYIDPPIEAANSPISTNVPDDAADFLQPYFWLQTREAAAKTMDIDYVYVRQER